MQIGWRTSARSGSRETKLTVADFAIVWVSERGETALEVNPGSKLPSQKPEGFVSVKHDLPVHHIEAFYELAHPKGDAADRITGSSTGLPRPTVRLFRREVLPKRNC